MFADEPAEGLRISSMKRCKVRWTPHEGEERPRQGGAGQASSRSQVRAPFAEEFSEDERDHAAPCAQPALGQVSVDWDKFETLKRSRVVAEGAPKQKRNKRVYNGAARKLAAQTRNDAKPKKLSRAENGKDPARVDALLRRSNCFCTKMCFAMFSKHKLQAFLHQYWSLSTADQAAFARHLHFYSLLW